jgi:E3 ubiquitin-protein ligase FANCL
VALPLRTKFNRNLAKWDATAMLRKNVECVLELQLPTPESAASDPDQQVLECAICYSFKLPREEGNGEEEQLGGSFDLPDHVCDNPKCRRSYHVTCLREWLRALPTTRSSFGTLCGQCPYCTEDIGVESGGPG